MDRCPVERACQGWHALNIQALILADNDVGGAVMLLRRNLTSEEWAEFAAALYLRFNEFEDMVFSEGKSN